MTNGIEKLKVGLIIAFRLLSGRVHGLVALTLVLALDKVLFWHLSYLLSI